MVSMYEAQEVHVRFPTHLGDISGKLGLSRDLPISMRTDGQLFDFINNITIK